MSTTEVAERKPLFVLAMEFQDLTAIDFPDECTPEQTAEIEAAWQAALETRYADMGARFEALTYVIEREKISAARYDAEIEAAERFLALRKGARSRHENHEKRAKAYAVQCLEMVGGEYALPALGLTLKTQKNGGLPRVEVADPKRLPPIYQIIEIVPDIKALANVVEKLGQAVEGVTVTRGKHLRIKGA